MKSIVISIKKTVKKSAKFILPVSVVLIIFILLSVCVKVRQENFRRSEKKGTRNIEIVYVSMAGSEYKRMGVSIFLELCGFESYESTIGLASERGYSSTEVWISDFEAMFINDFAELLLKTNKGGSDISENGMYRRTIEIDGTRLQHKDAPLETLFIMTVTFLYYIRAAMFVFAVLFYAASRTEKPKYGFLLFTLALIAVLEAVFEIPFLYFPNILNKIFTGSNAALWGGVNVFEGILFLFLQAAAVYRFSDRSKRKESIFYLIPAGLVFILQNALYLQQTADEWNWTENNAFRMIKHIMFSKNELLPFWPRLFAFTFFFTAGFALHFVFGMITKRDFEKNILRSRVRSGMANAKAKGKQI